MKKYKKYLPVISVYDEYSTITPLFIVWNGEKYKIEKIIEKRQAKSSVGGYGILYRCLINGKERNLFYEGDRWFIESYKP